jgi:N-methylhydantoinase B
MPLKAGGFKLLPGDIILYLVSGGGGYGDPLERPEEWVLTDLRDGYVSVDGAREDYGVVISGDAVDSDATAALRKQLVDARLHVEVVEAEEDHYDDMMRRRARLSPDMAQRLGVVDDDLVEYVNPRGAHVRAWVTVDESLEGDASPLGPKGRSICSATAGSKVYVRRPYTHAMRRQADDLATELPLGRLFSQAA